MVRETVRITGLDDTLKKLQALPKEISGKRGGPVLAALKKGAKVIQRQAIANLEANADKADGYANTGTLAKSVAIGRDPKPENVSAYSCAARRTRTARKRLRRRAIWNSAPRNRRPSRGCNRPT